MKAIGNRLGINDVAQYKKKIFFSKKSGIPCTPISDALAFVRLPMHQKSGALFYFFLLLYLFLLYRASIHEPVTNRQGKRPGYRFSSVSRLSVITRCEQKKKILVIKRQDVPLCPCQENVRHFFPLFCFFFPIFLSTWSNEFRLCWFVKISINLKKNLKLVKLN